MSKPTQPISLASRGGRRLLSLLCAIAFLDFVDASITNVALPAIQAGLGFSASGLAWVPSAYLLTYGGFMLLGGRLADLIGRRRMLLFGVVLVGVASTVGGFAQSPAVFVVARLAQGLGAALMLPAALSVLTTTFTRTEERHAALGIWGAVAGLSSAAGILIGGGLTEGPGWRWVMFVNPIACAALIPAIMAIVPPDSRAQHGRRIDILGGLLLTGGMLLLVLSIVQATDHGWSAPRVWWLLAAALLALVLFALQETRTQEPLFPFALLRTRGLVAANLTGLAAFGGMLSMFYFLTLYMQMVLGFSPIRTGLAYLPLTAGIVISSRAGAKAAMRWGTRPVIVTGAVIAASGLFLLGQISADGSYPLSVLPGMLLVACGTGPVFVAVTAAANAGVPEHQAGLAAAILSSAQNVGAALGLAIMSGFAARATTDAIESGSSVLSASADGYGRALIVGSVLVAAAALVALRTTNARHAAPPSREPAASAENP